MSRDSSGCIRRAMNCYVANLYIRQSLFCLHPPSPCHWFAGRRQTLSPSVSLKGMKCSSRFTLHSLQTSSAFSNPVKQGNQLQIETNVHLSYRNSLCYWVFYLCLMYRFLLLSTSNKNLKPVAGIYSITCNDCHKDYIGETLKNINRIIWTQKWD